MTVTVSSLDYLSSRYPPTVTVDQLSEITTEHPNTIRNLVSKGTYAIPSFKIGAKRLFRLIDVASYLDQQFAAANRNRLLKKRGRPTKVEQIARQQAAQAR